MNRLIRRHPIAALFLLAVLSNLAGSVFSVLYNHGLIVGHYLDDAQRAAFWQTVGVYNGVAYPACLFLMLRLLLPLARCLRRLRNGEAVPAGTLVRCQRLLVNLPFYQMCINFTGWLPGAAVFPVGVGLLAGWDGVGALVGPFAVSFAVSAFLTTAQTYFLVEAFLFRYVYPDFFRDDRPAEISGRGVLRITFRQRMTLYWVAVALVPLVALLAVVLEFPSGQDQGGRLADLRRLALGVTAVSVVSSAVIGAVVGRTLLTWLRDHTEATERIAHGDYDHRIAEKRPGEFGRLSDRVNDMAAALGRGRRMRETFGQMVGPEVRDEILERWPDGLGGEVEDVTIVFVDLRGFTRRSARETPQRVFELLHDFFTLCFAAVHAQRGLVNKFLGDGLMAIFGAPSACPDHADRAVAAALDLVRRLNVYNGELAQEGQPPLAVGVGVHSGPALVGCVGGTLPATNQQRVRKEFTALGATVNLAQRLEQLTKTCGGPILLSESTRLRLMREVPATCLGPQAIQGCEGGVVVYRLGCVG